jgi:hypothetical protein
MAGTLQVAIEVRTPATSGIRWSMIETVDLSRRTWHATLRLAVIISIAAALLVVTLQPSSSIPDAAIVLPVMAVAFTASWIQTGRVQRQIPATLPVRRR